MDAARGSRRPGTRHEGTAPLGRLAGLVAWVAFLVVVLAVFGAMGAGALAAPPLTRPGEWGGWLVERDAAEAAFAVLRVVVIGLAWYLLAVTVLATGARLARAGRLVTVVDVLTLPAVRRLVHGAVGLGLATTVAAGVAAHGGAPVGPTRADVALAASSHDPDEDAPVTMRLLDDDVEMQHLTDGADDGDGADGGGDRGDGVGDDRGGDEAPALAPAVWVAEAGDHLWSISARALEQAWGRGVTDRDVAAFWREVVELNRPGLPDPANPDLLYPGHEVQLPPVPPAPAR